MRYQTVLMIAPGGAPTWAIRDMSSGRFVAMNIANAVVARRDVMLLNSDAECLYINPKLEAQRAPIDTLIENPQYEA